VTQGPGERERKGMSDAPPPTWKEGRCVSAPRSGALAQSEPEVFADFAARTGLEGAKVLELGGALPPRLAAAAAVRRWLAIDPLARESSDGVYQAVRGRAERIDAPDGEFDHIFSCNALHHFGELPRVLAEARRLLRQGGSFYAHFGPIWSAPDGHHLELLHGNVTYTFWGVGLIPPWYHLACTPEELREVLASAIDPALAAAVVEFVHHSPALNRLYFEDYLRLFWESGLAMEELRTCDVIDYENVMPPYRSRICDEIEREGARERARRLHGQDKRNLSCRDLLVVLRKL